MSRKRNKRRIERAAPFAVTPGGTMYTLPAGAIQSTYGQTFYGGSAQNVPTQGDALFSPGVPLYPIKSINPNGLPVQWRFPPQYNTQPVDRSMGDQNIPSFEQLRMLAKMFYGIGLCERTWFDLVPRMQLEVKLTDEAIAGGAEPKQYQKQIAYFKNFFSKPDGHRDIHTWLRMALREQTQIDELYIYKNRKRNGELLGLELVAGDQMKPLLDQWGHIPPAPEYAYQQYPWGIPGMMYTTEQMIHYQESPATDTPYGLSRVERIILVVNLALKKMKKDLAHYASGNIPSGIMEVPPDLNWTPDQIDSYEQMWNALLAGNINKQVQVKFTQPGMKYTKLDDFSPDTAFDQFLLNVSVASYGLSMQDIAFTEAIHKSSGDSQQNMTYRRTIDPLAQVYSRLLTDIMHKDFDPSLQGDLFEITFSGFDEEEDLQTTVAAYAQAAGAGLIGLTDATKALGFPEPKDAPYIGRVMLAKDGPIFIDDMAQPDARKAASDAKMAGYELATHPPEPQQTNDEQETAKNDGQASPAQKAAPSAQKAPTSKSDDKDTKERAIGTADDTAPHHTGMMVAFMLDAATAQKLAIPDGELPEDMHVTLAFLGDMADFKGDISQLKNTLASFAATSSPLQGYTGGLGRFTASESSDGMTPVIALVNVIGLQAWRTQLIQALETIGAKSANDFDYTPHITLAYVDEDEPLPVEQAPKIPLKFDTLCLAVGDDRFYFPIGPQKQDLVRADFRRWRSRAIEDKKNNRVFRGFTTTLISPHVHERISSELERCESVQDVRDVFERAKSYERPTTELATSIASLFEDVERRGKHALTV